LAFLEKLGVEEEYGGELGSFVSWRQIMDAAL
jgi:hypothetical protein